SSLSPADGRVFQAAHLRLTTEDRLFLVGHHLVVDGVSWRVLVDDLSEACDAIEAGREVALGPHTDSVEAWATALNRRIGGTAVEEELVHSEARPTGKGTLRTGGDRTRFTVA